MAERDLFNSEPEPQDENPRADRQASPRQTPLAARMRPRTLDEYADQQHILKPGMLLRRAIEADRIQSLIFYGPPGTGKTTLAQIIANRTESKFERLSGVESNVASRRWRVGGVATAARRRRVESVASTACPRDATRHTPSTRRGERHRADA